MLDRGRDYDFVSNFIGSTLN